MSGTVRSGAPVAHTIDIMLRARNGLQRGLLTASDEVDLARQIEAGVLAAERLETDPFINLELAAELASLVKLGKNAQIRMIEANTGLVAMVARNYVGQGLDWDDLMQEGTYGLMLAVEKFDFTRGLKFSTHAVWWIRYGLTVAVGNTARTIRLPRNVHARVNKYRKVRGHLNERLQRAPTELELSQELKCSTAEIKRLRALSEKIVSLNLELNEAGDTLASILPDRTVESPEQGFMQRQYYDRIAQLVTMRLSTDDLEYLNCSLGFTSGEPKKASMIRRQMLLSKRDGEEIETRIACALDEVRDELLAGEWQ